MGREAELKLEGPAGAAAAALRLPWLRKMTTGPIKREKLVSVYFDTRKSRLRDHGLSLRVRRIGRKRLQTIKADGEGTAGAFGRMEWEEEIEGDEPHLEHARGTALEPLAKRLRKKLRPVFETVVQRTRTTITIDDTLIEIAADAGKVKTPSQSDAIDEIELELKQGDPAKLADVTERLAKTIPVTVGLRSKSERGYALSNGGAVEANTGDRIVLDESLSAAEGLKAIAMSCLRHFAANRQPVLNGDPEGIHQMRVGLRRLRAALSVFKDLLQDRQTESLKSELRWLTEQMGPARDFEVLLNEKVTPLQDQPPGKPEMALLRSELEQRRKKGLERARQAVESDRYRQIVLRTALWLIAGQWTTDADPLRRGRRDRSLREFAGDVLTGRTRKIIKKVRKIEALDDARRHKVRIAVKKLRYAVEFFDSLFDDKKVRPDRNAFGRVLKDLQDALGKLNDIAVHGKIAGTIVHQRRPTRHRPEKAFALGIVAGQDLDEIKAHMKAAARAGNRLAKLPEFWRYRARNH